MKEQDDLAFYMITFKCGHMRQTRQAFPMSESEDSWVGTKGFCDECQTVQKVVSSKQI